MKKIVILNGSPRRNGNTSALVKAFTQGAESAGNTVTEFFLDSMEIHGCRGCFGGHSSQECPCVQKDDMSQIYPAVKESDVVVLATPLYYWNMSGQIRTVRFRTLHSLFSCRTKNGLITIGFQDCRHKIPDIFFIFNDQRGPFKLHHYSFLHFLLPAEG